MAFVGAPISPILGPMRPAVFPIHPMPGAISEFAGHPIPISPDGRVGGYVDTRPFDGRIGAQPDGRIGFVDERGAIIPGGRVGDYITPNDGRIGTPIDGRVGATPDGRIGTVPDGRIGAQDGRIGAYTGPMVPHGFGPGGAVTGAPAPNGNLTQWLHEASVGTHGNPGNTDEQNTHNVIAHLLSAIGSARDPNLKASLSTALAALHKHTANFQKMRQQALQGKVNDLLSEMHGAPQANVSQMFSQIPHPASSISPAQIAAAFTNAPLPPGPVFTAQ